VCLHDYRAAESAPHAVDDLRDATRYLLVVRVAVVQLVNGAENNQIRFNDASLPVEPPRIIVIQKV
jgi:hypothetical protein